MAESFAEGLFKSLQSGVESRSKKGNHLDILELMLKQGQLERLKKEDEVQAENLRALVAQRQREQEMFPATDPFATQFPQLLGKSRSEALGLIPSLLTAQSKAEMKDKPRPLTNFESQQVISLAGSGRRLNKISKQLSEVQASIGPLNPKGRSQLFLQLSRDPKFATFKKDVLQEFNEYRKRITGAQAVFKEIQFLQEATLNPTDPPELFIPKLNDFIEEAEFNRLNLTDMLQLQNKPVPKSLKSSFKVGGTISDVFKSKPSKEDIIAELQRRKK